MKPQVFGFLVLGVWFNSNFSYGQMQKLPITINSATIGDSMSSMPASGTMTRSSDSKLKIKLVCSCFGTNLRHAGNPLSPDSTIEANLTLTIGGSDAKIQVKFPGQLVTEMGLVSPTVPINPQVTSDPTGVTAGIYGNAVLLSTPFLTSSVVQNSGAVSTTSQNLVKVKEMTFSQVVPSCDAVSANYASWGYASMYSGYTCGEYMGMSGPIEPTIGAISLSADSSNLEINVAFPGQNGFCGGYFSPLMLFTDKSRPNFENVSSFPLNSSGATYWPSAGHPGWILALDKEKNGKILTKGQLFGVDEKHSNGFETLKEHDLNKDQFIDKKDRVFPLLVLWNDKNGNGVSDPDELIPASKIIQKISLHYKNDSTENMGPHAEGRQQSQFWYKNSAGKLITGEIIDIWLAPAEGKHLLKKGTSNEK